MRIPALQGASHCSHTPPLPDHDFKRAIEEIKLRAPIEEIVRQRVPELKRKGKLYEACCPFHEEKTPSFYLFDDHYHCFGCGAHGDVIAFVREVHSLGFIDALKWLAERGGLDSDELFPKKNEHRIKWQNQSKKTDVLKYADDYFKESLWGEEGLQARAYLEKRGFSSEQMRDFGFGYAPDRSDGLTKLLSRKGVSLDQMVDCSLADLRGVRGVDFFRHRIMVPIKDTQGRLIAFGGRACGPSTVDDVRLPP